MSSAKRKGSAFERKLVKILSAIPGWSARRQPLSGALQAFPHDISAVDPLNREWIVEAKKWKNGWRTGDNALGKADMLIIERDYGDACIYMPLTRFAELVGVIEELKNEQQPDR